MSVKCQAPKPLVEVKKVYIVCRSWCDGYEDHGWDIMGTCATATLAENKMVKMIEDRREDPDDWWVYALEVEE